MKRRIVKVITVILALTCAFTCFTGCKKTTDSGVSKYTITAEVDPASMTVKASMTVNFINRTPVALDEVKFHLYPAAYRDGAQFTPVTSAGQDAAYPGGVSYGGITIDGVTGGEYGIDGSDDDILSVKLPSSILPSERAVITIEYTLKIPKMRHRLGYYDGTINLGNWYPVECAYDCGWVESPYYAYGDPFNLTVCDYDVSITAPKGYVVAMSGKSDRKENGDVATTHAKINKARDFAAVLGQFDRVSRNVNGTEVTYYYLSDSDPEAHLNAACDSIAYFSEKFCKYPYSSYAVVQTPFNQGGMEYSALVYASDSANSNMLTEIIIHETAHQWWYGLVGNDQISHAWLDESLAEYSTTLFYKSHPDYGVSYDARIADAMGGFSLYCEIDKNADTSMDRHLRDFKSETEYTYMTYVKGQLMYDSLSTVIGEKQLYAGLKRYANKYAYSTATPDDLIACLEYSSKRELKSFMGGFLDGTAKLYSHS